MRVLQSGRSHAPVMVLLFAAAIITLAINAQALAADPDFKIGDRYTLLVRRGDLTVSPDGTLIQATPRWLVLKAAFDNVHITGIPYLMDVPLVGLLFQRTHHQSSEQHIWIPREAATIEPRQPEAKHTGGEPISDSNPPANLFCRIAITAEGKIVNRFGKLVSLDDDQLVLARTYDDPADAPRMTIRRQDVLCIEFEAYPASDEPGKAGQ